MFHLLPIKYVSCCLVYLFCWLFFSLRLVFILIHFHLWNVHADTWVPLPAFINWLFCRFGVLFFVRVLQKIYVWERLWQCNQEHWIEWKARSAFITIFTSWQNFVLFCIFFLARFIFSAISFLFLYHSFAFRYYYVQTNTNSSGEMH